MVGFQDPTVPCFLNWKNYLVPHIFDGDAFDWFEVGVSALNEDPVNAFILAVDQQLGKDDNVLRVAGTVRDLSRCNKNLNQVYSGDLNTVLVRYPNGPTDAKWSGFRTSFEYQTA